MPALQAPHTPIEPVMIILLGLRLLLPRIGPHRVTVVGEWIMTVLFIGGGALSEIELIQNSKSNSDP